MKTLKVLLQEVVSGIKAWVNSNFAQESNAVHKTGNETVNGNKTFTGNVIQNQAGGTNVYCATCDGAVKGDLTSSGMFSIVCKDGSSANMETSGLAAVYMGQDTSGSYVALRADTSYNNTRYNASVSLDIDPTAANNNAIFRPRRDNTIDLGSSSYQFKNLYANNYYYKGTAWGLDKANFWTNTNKFYGITIAGHSGIRWLRDGYTAGTIPESTMYYGFQNAYDSNEDVFDRIRSYISTTGGNMREHFKYAWGDLSKYIHKGFWISNDGSDSEQSFLVNRVIPETDSATDLGTTTNRWKTFNGINPGELSLPEGGNSTSITIDITDWYVQDPDYPNDPNKKILDGTEHEVETSVPGWLLVQFENVAGNFAYARQYNAGKNMADEKIANGLATDSFPRIFFVYPIHTKLKVSIKSKSATVRIFPCIGSL